MGAIVDIKVSFHAGVSIEEAVSEAYAIVQKIKIPIQFDFNGIAIWIEPKELNGATFSVKGE